MKREDIEKAAAEYCSIKPYKEFVLNKNAFMAGAAWRMGSVWHDASEVPEHKLALVEYPLLPGGYGYLVAPDPRGLAGSVTRWAYIEDLLPERKEEEE